MSIQKKINSIIDKRNFVIQLITSSNLDGESVYAYMFLPKLKAKELKEKLTSSEPFDLSKEGLVLLCGVGKKPSEEHINMIKNLKEYISNFDFDVA